MLHLRRNPFVIAMEAAAGSSSRTPGHMITLARHGQTAWNREGRYQGRSDPPLCQEGIDEAVLLAGQLRGAGIGSIFTSPLCRAQQTAQIIATELSLGPLNTDPRLTEIAFGAWEGLTQFEVRLRWPELLQSWKHAPETVRFPGGENLQEARLRLRAFLADQTSQQEPHAASTLVITHTGLIRIAILEARLASSSLFRKIRIAPASRHRFVLRKAVGTWDPVIEHVEESSCASP
jgi:broad specificity phosphatase PhoE